MGEAKRVAVITGAAQGIGRKTSEVLAERGYSLALFDLQAPDDALKSVRRHGVETLGRVGSVADEAAVDGFVREVHERWGQADVLVNNAAISFIATAEKSS
jgi:NAD(P)-dependent dehydrogenase (short-subunit alcohol dehydrogenase family)